MTQPDGSNCEICNNPDWWGHQQTHCRTCHYTWNIANKQAHCVYCHRHFSGPTGFDSHLKTGTDGRSIFHLDPPGMTKVGGMWQGPPDVRFSASGNGLEDESSAPLDLDTRKEIAAFSPAWLPKPR